MTAGFLILQGSCVYCEPLATAKNKAGDCRPCAVTGLSWYVLTLVQGPGRLRRVRGERVHQWRTQAVVWLQADLLDPAAYVAHFGGVEPRFDDRRNERRELRFLPAGLRRQFGVDEVQ